QFEAMVAEAFAEETGQSVEADAADVGADGLDGAVEELLGGQAGEVLQCAHGETPGCGGDCGPRLGGGLRTLTIAGARAGHNASMTTGDRLRETPPSRHKRCTNHPAFPGFLGGERADGPRAIGRWLLTVVVEKDAHDG